MTQNILTRFIAEEIGNTTVDWIVLTAGMVLLAATVTFAITGPSTGTADKINTSLAGADPNTP
jgi:hypothetical protein